MPFLEYGVFFAIVRSRRSARGVYCAHTCAIRYAC